MESIDKQDNSAKSGKGSIFLKRADGFGWTLNFSRPAAYLVLALFIVILLLGVLWGSGVF